MAVIKVESTLELIQQLEAAKQRELELLAVIDKQANDLIKALGWYPKPEPSQALREHEAKLLEDAAVWFEQREYLSVVEHLRRMAEERRKK